MSIVYLNGSFLAESEAKVSVNDRGFMFADGTYDVLRCYNGKLFHGEEHFRRLAYCLQELRIDFLKLSLLEDIISELLRQNNLSDKQSSIYIQITRGVYKRTHVFPIQQVEPTVYVAVKEFIPFKKEFVEGVKCITVEDIRWQRCDIKTIALLANVMAVQKAYEQNAYEAIFIRNGFITEASHSSVFGVIGDNIYTHPANNLILSGISREIVINLCRKSGLTVIEEPIPENWISKLDELMVVGTSTEVMPVVLLNDHQIGDGIPGKVQQKLWKLFNNYMSSYFSDNLSG